MQGEQVVLTDMLQCREQRAQIQDTFIETIPLSGHFILYEYPRTRKDK